MMTMPKRQKLQITTSSRKVLADLATPVGLFYKVREAYAEALLLESSDYSSKENSLSFICFDPLMTMESSYQGLSVQDHTTGKSSLSHPEDMVAAMEDIVASIRVSGDPEGQRFLGLFGYTAFDSVQYFESVQQDLSKPRVDIPLMRYAFYRYIYVFDHYTEDLYLLENCPRGTKPQPEVLSQLLNRQDHLTYQFETAGAEQSNMEDDDFRAIVRTCKEHCQRGDVFQIVPSRRFTQQFRGDEFNVYRALRSINPSPYLFYFDYGTFKIFGSSPEAQLVVDNGEAEIHPIAGTFRRTGDPAEDQAAAQALKDDPKESAEHIMLVDLARNDLSKHCTDVEVDTFKEVQYFSHVIHLTSKVKGRLREGASGYRVFADSFPAGTLSGAPKHKAMQLLYDYEPTARGHYGGGLGLIKLNGDINHAIIIRSFLSINQELHYQAGAGIVIDSDPESELQEVNNKLAALKRALDKAQTI